MRTIDRSAVVPGDIGYIAKRYWVALRVGSVNGPVWCECKRDGVLVESKDPPRYWCGTSVQLVNGGRS